MIESILMKKIVSEFLPMGILSDSQIDSLSNLEKESLYQTQKKVIQEFQNRSDKEIFALSTTLRAKHEQLLMIRRTIHNQQLQKTLQKTVQPRQSNTQQQQQQQHHHQPKQPSTKRAIKQPDQVNPDLSSPRKRVRNSSPPPPQIPFSPRTPRFRQNNMAVTMPPKPPPPSTPRRPPFRR